MRTGVWLAAAVVLHGLVYFFLVPPWMGEDEPWHLEYARNLAVAEGDEGADELTVSQRRIHARTGADPDEVVRGQALITASMREHRFWQRVDFAGWEHGADSLDHFVRGHSEAGQPPLYYAACAVLLKLSGLEDVGRQLGLLRGLSFLCYLAVVWLTYALARRAADEPWVAVAAALVVAWLPMHARQSAVVSNDVLVKVFAAATLWLVALGLTGRGGKAVIAGAVACAALALATKPTGIGVAAPLGVGLALSVAGGRGRRAGLFAGLLAVGLLAAGAVLYWMTVGSAALPDGDLRAHLRWLFSGDFARKTVRTFFGSFNWYTRELPGPMYTAGATAVALGLAGSLFAAFRRPVGLARGVIAVCWLAVLTQLLAMVLRGFAAGRFFFPVLPALATLVAVGFVAPLPERWRARAAALLASALVVYDGFALWNGLFPNQYLEWGS